MSVDAKTTTIPASLFARVGQATRYVISGVRPDGWFGPQQPMQPMAPPEVKGRQFDYPFGVNLNYTPRASEPISFADLRSLADALPLLRAVIETRKDQVAAFDWTVRPVRGNKRADAPARASKAATFLSRPDRRHSFDAWLRMVIEDMLVIDAACLYPRFSNGGALHSLDVVDGATITPLIGLDGRAPDAPDPAYQQVLHGIPAADFSADELMYRPRNIRSHRVYGFSPVEQIALTINIALRRDAATLEYYNSGTVPDAFATLPKEWTPDQIRSFQDYFDALLSGNLGRRRMLKFVPSEFKLIEARQPPLKDQYDEWLARLICYAFSVPASAFVSQVNRATSSTLRLQATQEGLVPLKGWIKSLLDTVVQEHLAEPDLEFVWVGDDAVDPLQQAQTLNILVAAGIKTREEARAELGLEGVGAKVEGVAAHMASARPTSIDKSTGGGNPYRDDAGQFTSAENAVAPGSAKKPPGQVAERTDIASDAALDPKPVQPEEGNATLVPAEGASIPDKLVTHQSTQQVLPIPSFEELRQVQSFRDAVFQALKDSNIDLPPQQRREQGFWIFQDQTTGEIVTSPIEGEFGPFSIDPTSPTEMPGATIIAWAHTHPYSPGEVLPLFPEGVPAKILLRPSPQDLELSLRSGLPGFLILKDHEWNSWTPKTK